MSKSKILWKDLPRDDQLKYVERAKFLIYNNYADADAETLAEQIYNARRN